MYHRFVLGFAEHLHAPRSHDNRYPWHSLSITNLSTLWTGVAPRNAAGARTLPKAEYEHEPTIELRAGLTELVFEQLRLCHRGGAV